MGLFDHLFKTKSSPGEEKLVEAPHEAGGAAKHPEAPARTPLPQRADPSAFLHPKNFVPRGAPSLTPAPRPGASSAGRPPERRTGSSGPTPATEEIVLTLGDVLSRIPTHYLKAGAHDAKRELRFKINDLSSDIARGRAAVPLSRIAQLVPDIFVKEIGREEDTEVRLPLQKLVEQIGLLRSRPKSAVVEKAARPAAPAEVAPPPRVVDIEAKKEVLPTPAGTSAPPPAAEEPYRPVISPPQVPAIILGEQALAGQKPFELKPAAEQTGAPVILGPSPTGEPAAAVPVAEALAPAPAPESLPATAAPVSAESPPLPEESARTSSSPPAAPAISEIPASAPAAAAGGPGIVIDWTAGARTAAEGEPKAPEAVVEPVRRESGPESRKLAPLESPEIDPGEEKIQLSLAAILRHCPPEIIVGHLPQVDDSVRITLPFAPIDRQLVKGQVEVSALRFIASLPEAYHKYFVAKVGVKVPIPLEEVFQNLPAPTHGLTPAPPTPPQVVLAPAAGFGVATPEIAGKVEGVPIVPEVSAAVPMPAQPEPMPATEAAAGGASTASASAVRGAAREEQAAATVGPVDEAGMPFSIFQPRSLPPEPDSLPQAVGAASTTPLAGPEPGSSSPPPPQIQGAESPAVPPAAAPDTFPDTSAVAASAVAFPPQPEAPAPVVPEPISGTDIPAPAALAPESHEATASTPSEPVTATQAQEPALTSAHGEPGTVAGEDGPKLVLQRPIFRPFVVPPPPIFGFAPPAADAPESTPGPPVEPPSLISSLTESAPPAPATGESGILAAGSESAATVPPITSESAAPPGLIAQANEPPPLPVAISKLEPGTSTPGAELDASPSSELIASALEDVAPETIVPFPLQPVPFADLAETFAHETTYAPDLAEVVHIDVPSQEGDAPAKTDLGRQLGAADVPSQGTEAPSTPVSGEVDTAKPAGEPALEGVAAAETAPPAADQPAPPAGHAPAKVVEVAAAAALGAIAAEILPHSEHQVVSAPEHKEAVAEPAAPLPPSEESERQAEAPSVDEHSVIPPEPPKEAATAAPAEPEQPPTPDAPTTPEPEPPAAAVPPPPSHLLFPLPKVPSEHAHLEVLPPPSLPLRRFDQDAVQALFMTEETLDLPKISRLAASLPGVYACVIATRDQACTGGNLPDGFDLAALLGLAPRVGEAAGRMPIGQLKHFTLYGDAYSVSFFERNGLSLCAVHRPRSFVPGVREKLVALADELSR